MTVIGEDTSERLDVIPAQFRVIVTRRPKLACRACPGTVVQAPAPARLIEGGIPTEALVAHVLVSRYADHLPLYRQAQIMARQGVIIDRSTLSFWMGYAAAEVAPVVARLREMMLASTRIFADETVVPVLDPGRGRTKQGYFWAIARDDRPWGGSDRRRRWFTATRPAAGTLHANALLGGYRGILQCDGYAAYKKLGGSQVRRPVHHAGFLLEPCAPRLLRSGQGEGADRDRDAEAHCRALRDRGRVSAARAPLTGWLCVRPRANRWSPELRVWFEAQIAKLPARGPTAEAIRYALNHWDGLERFLDDGRIELDNNSVERAMRPVGLSRKNSLFAGSDEGGENWACLASLIETCKLNRRQSAGLFHRFADTPRERLAAKTHRRVDALELAARPAILNR